MDDLDLIAEGIITHEEAIAGAYVELILGTTRAARSNAWDKLRRLHEGRRPEQVARMEREQGLARASSHQ